MMTNIECVMRGSRTIERYVAKEPSLGCGVPCAMFWHHFQRRVDTFLFF
jgi:hypothetical protein